MSPATRHVVSIISLVTVLGGASRASAEPPEPPAWAYPLNPNSPLQPTTDAGLVRHVPGSVVGLTRTQILDRFAAADWHPEGHPPLPNTVAHGRKPDLVACGFCHYPNGQGRPENASLAGLAASYIVEQVTAMRDGSRRSAQPEMLAPSAMLKVAAHADADEVAQAAAYFSQLTYKPWITVIETDTVPRPEIHGVSAYAAAADGAREPIGERIVELPEDEARTDLRDDASGFVAYVPSGAIGRGRDLASSAAGERLPCRSCHGTDLRGDSGPALAGRSPSFLFRQLFDIRAGTRSGLALEPMRIEVAALSPAEMRDLVAYIASLPPR